jgi:hypothetical protein
LDILTQEQELLSSVEDESLIEEKPEKNPPPEEKPPSTHIRGLEDGGSNIKTDSNRSQKDLRAEGGSPHASYQPQKASSSINNQIHKE